MSEERENETHKEESCLSSGCILAEMLDFLFNLPGQRLAHFRQAKIEFWRGIRDLVDRRIECLETATERRKTRVRKVQVE